VGIPQEVPSVHPDSFLEGRKPITDDRRKRDYPARMGDDTF
jgi:hypothetical protein